LQKALPNTVIVHSGVSSTEAEQKAIGWALDRKAEVVRALARWESIKEVPKDAVMVAHIGMPDDGVKAGAEHLQGIRCLEWLAWPGLSNADEEANHLATLTSLLSLNLRNTNLTARGMERLTALKQLESLAFWHVATLTPEALSFVSRFDHLVGFTLNGCPLSDAGLEQLAKASNLRGLTLEYCSGPLTGAALEHLARLAALRQLTLAGTPLHETAKDGLRKLSQLRILDVRRTRITAADVADLGQALPRCAILWDGGLIVPGVQGGGP
jgi:hypothetical protein